jgi:hypothetical protein
MLLYKINAPLKVSCCHVSVAHACNPSYSGGRDQEDHSSKPAQANSLQDPISKLPITKRTGGVTQGLGPKFKPQYQRGKKRLLYLSEVPGVKVA